MNDIVEVVIKIPKEQYDYICNGQKTFTTELCLLNAVCAGITLPEGHGDLKDMGNLQYIFDLTREDPIYSGKDIEWAIKSMKTIIEVDKKVESAEWINNKCSTCGKGIEDLIDSRE